MELYSGWFSLTSILILYYNFILKTLLRLSWLRENDLLPNSFSILYDLTHCDLIQHEKSNQHTAGLIFKFLETIDVLKYQDKISFAFDCAISDTIPPLLESLGLINAKYKTRTCGAHNVQNYRKRGEKDLKEVIQTDDTSSKF